MTETSWSDGATITSPVEVNYGTTSESRQLEVTEGNTKITIDSITPLYGDVTISYTLENDESDISSIKPEYSTNGTTYYEMTSAGGDDGVATLATDTDENDGISYDFIWDTATDLGLDYNASVYIRIKVYDKDARKGSIITSSREKKTIDNTPEAPTLVSPTASYFRKDETPVFVFTIPNPKAGNSILHFKIEVDSQSTYDSGDEIAFESYADQVGWEYKDESANWIAIPVGGVDIISTPALIGNQVRYTVQTDNRLDTGNYYWRATAGGVV